MARFYVFDTVVSFAASCGSFSGWIGIPINVYIAYQCFRFATFYTEKISAPSKIQYIRLPG